jgi:spore germination protein
MKKQVFLLFIGFSLILTGCVEKEIIDDINIEVGVGYDLLSKDHIEGTIMVPIFKPDKNIGNFTFSATALSSRDLIQEIQRKSSQPLVTGSLEIAIFGESLARQGIFDLTDGLQRDPSIGARIFLAVSEDVAKEILEGNYGTRGNSIHLSDLLQQNIQKRNLPITNLHIFLYDYYQKGADAFLPILKKTEPEIVEIVGIALFKDDKMVDKIPADKMFYFKLLTDKFSEGNFEVEVDGNVAAIRDLNSKHKFKLTSRNPYSLTIEIKIKGLLREYTGSALTPAIIKEIEKEIEARVNANCTAMISSFQEQGIEPLGIGQFIKSKTRKFDFKKWEDDYKNISVKVKTDASITEVGVIE